MADQRKGGIAWTSQTWNPLRGCSRVSEGCRNCYAETMAARFAKPGEPYAGTIRNGKWSGQLREVPDVLTAPLRWTRPRRVFVNSMSDLFHDNASDAFRDRIFAVMALAGRHVFQVLTKRPATMRRYVTALGTPAGAQRLEEAARDLGYTTRYNGIPLHPWPIRNVWLGVSVEDQAAADERIPLLLGTPAAIRFVSAEPLLDHLNLRPYLWRSSCDAGLDWVIVGGESGPGARPCRVSWVERIVADCQGTATRCFVKQLGKVALLPAEAGALDLRHPKGGDPAEWPEALRVQEWPA